ncbi:M24 family metallopeptidase [[Clostridium] hylemonae]|nr:aminopeptidase P family protein [[Clostridium] hylemonae]QEK16409.1 Xaa-Pro dipeptidase [[Clostridium] hylemonae DSM 15053]
MKTLEERRKKLCRLLREEGIQKAVIGEPMNIVYLTGIHIVPYERFYGLVADAEKEEFTMINPGVDTGCMKGTLREVTYQDENGPFEAVKEVVGTCDVLAVDKKYYSMAVGELFSGLQCRITDIGMCAAKLRMYKDDREVETMQFAAKIVDEAIAYVSDRIRPGMTEKELNMMLYTYMSRYPGFITDEFIILVLAAANSANPHGVSGDYAFKEGDIVLMDFCAYYNYYWSDITRCVFVGEAKDPKLVEIYEIVRRANLAAISAVRPGVKAKEIDKAARDVITEAGYGELFLHRTGHGLGLSVHEEPYITAVNELVLEEGMTFTIEPGIYIEGTGGVRIEDDILVTKDGCRILTGTSKKLEDHIIRY